ncbi:RNA-binding domain-containing protein [Thermoanaerobacterium sp. DL9XJH110]|uniref:RNA-binding domain-containing protein n=1 Tax=Thermoanaerobacterium sp. DL9XJH110 TaxID=3386643 RepID=UPI003BB616A7
MDCAELLRIIKKGEDSKTQFKARIDSIDALAAELCAFANTEGGFILVGVSDRGELIGVDDVNKLNQMISNAASAKLEPPLSVFTQNLVCEGKIIVAINVPRGENKPYAANKTDYWIKVGADKRRASREELRRLMQASGGIYADELIVPGTSIEDLDMFIFRDFYEREYGVSVESSYISIEKLLNNLKLMKDGMLTLAGLMLFGRRPALIRPQFIIKAVAFPGNDVSLTRYLDSENIEGILLKQYEDAMAFLKRNLRKVQLGQNVNLPGILEIPEIALQEAVVNALVHRDYFIDSSIRIFVFEDRVEIISPGKLPNTATVDSIKQGIQIARNPILLSFIPKLKIPYRGIGSGIRRMIAECKAAGLQEPELIEDVNLNQFRVVFHRRYIPEK